MNTVSVIGTITGKPRLHDDPALTECTVRLAVQRRLPDGTAEPGVVYVTATTYGAEAREIAELEEGDKIGLTGRLTRTRPIAGSGS
jgi:single-stranded DNA-binding protein